MTDISGRYEIKDQLGSGGAGVVYRVFDWVTGSEMALKLLTGDAGDLAVEFTLLSRLNHPHVLRVYDYGYHQGHPFFTMDVLANAQPLSTEAGWPHFFQFLRGLDYIHAQSIVHRDLKPPNIMVSNNRAYLADFGLAAAHASGGTLFYASPEQLREEQVDHRSDLYTVGVLLYERAFGAGRHPFNKDYIKTRNGEVVRSPEGAANPIWPVIQACLEADPAARPDSAGEILLRLAGVLGLDEPLETPETAIAWVQPATFQGQTAEMSRLDEWFAAGHAAIYLTGAAGIGKSRLGREWSTALLTSGRVGTLIRARGAVEDIITNGLQLLPEASDLHQVLAVQPGSLESMVGQLLRKLPDPVLVILDDVHQVDKAGQESLACLAEELREDVGVCFLLIGQNLAANDQTITLADLGQNETRQILDSVLPGLHPEAAGRLTGYCGGNPAFIEEIARLLVEQGLVTRTRQGWYLRPGQVLPHGDTFQELIHQQVTHLPAPVSVSLVVAAVLGRRFPVAAFEALNTGEATLSVLERYRFIEIKQAQAGFKSGLVAEAIYEDISPDTRQTLHHRAGQWFEQNLPQDIEALARHFSQAGAAQRAAGFGYVLAAAREARQALRFHEALAWYDRIRQLRPTPDQAWEGLIGQFEIWRQLADLTGQKRILDELKSRSRSPEQKAIYFNHLARWQWERGQYFLSLTAAKQALAAARTARSSSEIARAYAGLAQVSFNGEEFLQTAHYLDEALVLNGYAEHIRANLLNMRGAAAVELGQVETADAFYRKALLLRRKISDRWGEAQTLGNLGRVAADSGDFSVAIARQEEAMA